MVVKAKTLVAARHDPGPAPASYDQDVVAWSVEQARLLRAGLFHLADVEHIADEIEDVGKSEGRELASRMAVLLAHRLKWEFQPTHRSDSRENTIREQQKKVLRRLTRTPSLRPELEKSDWIEDVWGDALTAAASETGMDIASFPDVCPWPLAKVILDNWTLEEKASTLQAKFHGSPVSCRTAEQRRPT